MNRYFSAFPGVYEQVRNGLDAAFGHPKTAVATDGTEVVTVSCLAPVEELPADDNGRVYCAVLDQDCDMPEVAPVLASILQQGLIVEIDESEYLAVSSPVGTEPFLNADL